MFVGVFEKLNEFADVVAALSGVAHGGVEAEGVVVSPPDSFAGDVARVDQVGDDPLGRPLGDADALGEVAEPCVWVAVEAEKDLGVV
jgi:hypothetical protein